MRSLWIAALAAAPLGIAVPPQEIVSKAEVAAIVAFTEGPTADADGNVYFTTMNRILRFSPGGKLSTYREPSNHANGMVFDAQFRLIACEAGDAAAGEWPRVTRTDIKTGRIEVLAEKYQGKRLNAPNDVTVDNKGRIYFTDQARRPSRDPMSTGVPGVYRIDPDGRLTRILTAPDIDTPNGLTISPDDRTFYLVETNQTAKGPRMIRAYDLQPDGSVTHMRVFHDFFPGRSADGLTVDSQGNVYAAAGLNRPRGTAETLDTRCGVYVFSPAGKLLQFIPIYEDTITNLAFGGADLKTLYVTAGKTLFQMRTRIAGTRR